MKIKVEKFDNPTGKCKFAANIIALDVDGEDSPITDREGSHYGTFTVKEKSPEALQARIDEVVARAKLNKIRGDKRELVGAESNGDPEEGVLDI